MSARTTIIGEVECSKGSSTSSRSSRGCRRRDTVPTDVAQLITEPCALQRAVSPTSPSSSASRPACRSCGSIGAGPRVIITLVDNATRRSPGAAGPDHRRNAADPANSLVRVSWRRRVRRFSPRVAREAVPASTHQAPRERAGVWRWPRHHRRRSTRRIDRRATTTHPERGLQSMLPCYTVTADS